MWNYLHSVANKTNAKKVPTAIAVLLAGTSSQILRLLQPISLLVFGLFSCNYRFCLLAELLPGFGRRLTYKISAHQKWLNNIYYFGRMRALGALSPSQDAAKVGNILSLYAEQHNFLIGQSCCQVFETQTRPHLFFVSVLLIQF